MRGTTPTINSKECVLAACAFKRPDRIPCFDGFWEFPDSWRERLGPAADLTDVRICVPNEKTFLTRQRRIREDGEWIYEVDGWGRTIRKKKDAYFVETLEVSVPAGTDIDSVTFDPPDLDARFVGDNTPTAEAKQRHCCFVKTGGPYLRSTCMRGETQFLIDIAGDASLARAIADKVGAHLTAVGVEALHRWKLYDTGVWIYDDMGYNDGPMFHPEAFEMVFLPAYRRMINAYKAAGAKYVFLHSDGDVRVILDMLLDAGIDGLNPLERRANMDVVKLREKYPRLILAGGMDNTGTLVNGPIEAIQDEAREIIELGCDGGVIIGTHSISPEIPIEHFVAYSEICMTDGNFSQGEPDDGHG